MFFERINKLVNLSYVSISNISPEMIIITVIGRNIIWFPYLPLSLKKVSQAYACSLGSMDISSEEICMTCFNEILHEILHGDSQSIIKNGTNKRLWINGNHSRIVQKWCTQMTLVVGLKWGMILRDAGFTLKFHAAYELFYKVLGQ